MSREVLVALALGGCASAGVLPSAPLGKSIATITVTSSSIPTNGAVPIDYTCDGKDLLPGLTWSSPPEGTTVLAVVIDDPDASSGTFTHLLAYNLPAEVHSLKEGADLAALGARLGKNDFGHVGYNGPCPPRREEHRYSFRLYALDKPLTLSEGATRGEVDASMAGHVLGVGALNATFGH